MSNHTYTSAPRGRSDQNIQDYPYRQQQYPDSHIRGQQQQYYSQQHQQRYDAYYQDQSTPLQPPRSHFSRQSGDAPQRGPPVRPPRPDQQGSSTQQQQQQRHLMYQQFFKNNPSQSNLTQDHTSAGAQDYPQPNSLHALINQLQRRAPLGPPPSARRGPASYYQHDVPIVHPIAEESSSTRSSAKHGSTVSSNNFPHVESPTYRFDDGSSSIYSRGPSMLPPARLSQHEDDIPTIPSIRNESPLNTLVRQASLGLKSKPIITTVHSPKLKNDTVSPDASEAGTPRRREFPLTGEGEREKAVTPPETRSASESSQARRPYPRSRGGSSDALGAALDASASDSDEPELGPAASVPKKSRSPLVPLELRNDTREDSLSPLTPSSTFRNGKKRPPHLDIEAVKEAQQRGSLTSLPELIKRATRLASNLDRGKTASRLGMSAWLADTATLSEKGKSATTSEANYRRSAGSLSDMLAAFPPPAAGTPPQSRQGRQSLRAWPGTRRTSTKLPSESDAGDKKKRCCCGMPLWLIILLIIIGICVIAAAIVVPVVLIVIPQQRNEAPATNTTSVCQSTYTCLNGGTSLLATTGSCQCLCINGFTGSTCADQDRTGCYTVTIGGLKNITLGSAVPRIINDAYNNYSIPLDSSALLGLFSTSSLSCTAENALITFNNLAQRDVMARQVASTSTAAPAATSNGIVFADGNPSSSTLSASSTVAVATSTTSVSPSATASITSSTNVTIDFARTAVLFVFQATSRLDSAIAAQQNFQRFFSSTSGSLASSASLGLGSGYTADLTNFRITLANGTSVGGRG